MTQNLIVGSENGKDRIGQTESVRQKRRKQRQSQNIDPAKLARLVKQGTRFGREDEEPGKMVSQKSKDMVISKEAGSTL